MSKNIAPFLIVAVIIIAGITGIFFLSNQKTQEGSNINLTPAVNPTEIPHLPTPTTAIINKEESASPAANMGNIMTTSDGLQIQDIVVGTGAEAKSGDTITVNYLGTLTNGAKFDSSYDRNQPFTTQIGVGQVIKGWDEGMVGMKIGGKRKLIIPASLGYGSQDMGTIPPNSTLIFEVELLNVK